MAFIFQPGRKAYTPLLILFGLAVQFAQADEKPKQGFRELQRFPAAEAHQAVAVDKTSFFAISSREIARYQKTTGKQLAKWTPPKESTIRHLNSGVVIEGKLYCAHSNWPKQPLENSIEVFDATTLKPLESLKFPKTTGAINWVDRQHDKWWVVFAFYGDAESVKKTRLVLYNDNWQQKGRWTFPETVVKRFLPYSNSGGAWGPDNLIYVTGHDRAELYALQINRSNEILEHVKTLPAPIAGQGIAWDRSDKNTLYGIIRSKKQVVKMRFMPAVK